MGEVFGMEEMFNQLLKQMKELTGQLQRAYSSSNRPSNSQSCKRSSRRRMRRLQR